MSIKKVSASELSHAIDQGHRLIDVRTPGEYRAEAVIGAELHPLDVLDAQTFTESHGADKPLYVLCQSGKRAQMAADKLSAAGLQNVLVVEGGTNAAKEAGVPTQSGKGTISIERQVRIAAGALVAIGSVAGLTVHAGFFAVPIFVGCGLVFAGVTDTCGMGMMLSKMPWNK